MPSVHGTCPVELPAAGTEKFHADLMNGLHAVAQPLTVLRAAIEILARPEGVGVDRKRYLEISATQVARTCDLFSCVRELVTSSVSEARQAWFDMSELLTPVIEEYRGRLQTAGVGLAVMIHEPRQPVFGDAERTEQAFLALLKTSASLSSRGDVIELRSTHAQGFLELTVLNARSHGKQLSSTDRLGLSLAEVNILSQQGRYRCTEDPFSFWFALPVHDSSQGAKVTAFPGTQPQQVH